jgi:hypothetical protein
MRRQVVNSENLTERDALQREFRTLIMLLTLVLSINNDGHATLPRSLPDYRGNLERNLPITCTALNAVAAILVRNFEHVAVVAHDPRTDTTPMRPNLESEGPDTLDILAMQDGGDDFNHHESMEIDTALRTMANPDNKYDRELPGYCVLAQSGKSHWPSIHLNPWDCLNIIKLCFWPLSLSNFYLRHHDIWRNRTKDPLSNHAATVADYINDYRNASHSQKTEFFTSFTIYIVATCWKKMFRQINHWSSQGFITILLSVPSKKLQHAFETDKVSFSEKDSILCSLLDEILVGLIMHSNPSASRGKLSHLLAVCPRVSKLKNGDSVIKCEQNVFFEFHHFIHAVLVAYYNVLLAFSEASKGGDINVAILKKVWNVAYLLWRITYSRIFRLYLTALGHVGALYLPQENKTHLYRVIVGTPQGGREVEVEEGGEEEEELRRLMDIRISHGNSSEITLVFLRWMQLQVSHFTAVNILSRLPRKLHSLKDVKISLIAVNQPRPDPTKKEPWEETILKLSSRLASTGVPWSPTDATPFDPQAIISFLQKRINKFMFKDEPRSIFKSFRNWQHSLPGSVHCEAALASLAVYTEQAINAEYRDKHVLTQLVNVCSCLHCHSSSDLVYRVGIGDTRSRCQNYAALLVGSSWTS